MRFSSFAAAAAFAGASSASPVLVRRQGGGSGLPANATIPDFDSGNVTYTPTEQTRNGTSLNQPIFESVPQGVNASTWAGYQNGTEPYAGASLILGNPSKNGTNTTLAWPGQPAGGLLIDKPSYTVSSNFDFQSLNLALLQEEIELDLFHNGLARFSVEEFEAAGLTADDRTLIQHMADQEVGHALAITNMLGPDRSAKQCVYQYPYSNVKEFILFSQLLTRWGEAGVYGFLGQLDSRPAAQILLQSITTEARQQMAFRQFQGLPAQPEFFETGIPQSYAWTLLSKYIKSCPPNNPRIEFTRFPDLNITNQPYALAGRPGINSNYTLTSGNGSIHFTWDEPGKVVGYDDLYITSTVAGEPKFLAFIDQLNVTYSPIYNVSNSSGVWQATADVPTGVVFPPEPQVVNSAFVSLVDKDVYLTPYNVSLIVNHTVAGPAFYQAS
ncbi:conserved fungal protein [Rhodosporidiobolus nylandii]